MDDHPGRGTEEEMMRSPIRPRESHPWWDEAACRGEDVELFYSEEPGPRRRALELCGSCPVRTACLESALAGAERFGVWGGMTEAERRRELRARGRQSRAA